MAGELQVKGTDELLRNLRRLQELVPQEVARALYEEAQIEKTESQRRTPVKTGALKGSHEVSEPVIDGDEISVTISVGGSSAPYALYVHENTEALHPSGGQAKFLESTVLESRPYLAARIARRMNLKRLI